MKTNIEVGTKIKHCTVLSIRKEKYELTKYLCQCECGSMFEVSSTLINNKSWKGHCGCLPNGNAGKSRKRTIELTPLQKIERGIKDYINDIKQGDYDVR